MNKIMTTFSLLLILSTQASAKDGQKAIYGSFDNEFVSMKLPRKIREMATGVSYLVRSSHLSQISSTETTIRGLTLNQVANVCSSEKFADNMVSGFCTGFLVGKDIVVTSGHCFDKNNTCANTTFAFGVNLAKEDSSGFTIPTNNLYSCKKVLTSFHEKGTSYDYAVIQLNREVKARHIFKLGDDSKITTKSKVAMLGHPLGLALTFSSSVPVKETYSNDVFYAQLDSFSGNSGSPVFDLKTEKVLGILTGGEDDFTESESCKKYAKYEYGSERITRISHVKDFIENYNKNN